MRCAPRSGGLWGEGSEVEGYFPAQARSPKIPAKAGIHGATVEQDHHGPLLSQGSAEREGVVTFGWASISGRGGGRTAVMAGDGPSDGSAVEGDTR